jgi:oligopeptide transport system ATP-binding protein
MSVDERNIYDGSSHLPDESGIRPPGPGSPLIEIRDLRVHFDLSTRGVVAKILGRERERIVKAVDGISLDIRKGETLGLVGESGCGKSTTGRAILQLVKPTGGSVVYHQLNLVSLTERGMRPLRRHLQMIFQDPYASLNPRMTVGSIISEPMKTFDLVDSKGLNRKTQELMRTVGLNPRYIKRYPHEFSGGQRQRIGIARALAASPEFIVADEPISALDVSIQAQIMNLMADLQEQFGLTYLFISHDLRAVRHVSDRVAVMYLGKLVELADAKDIYGVQIHPYTKALISAVPVPDPQVEKVRQRIVLQGDVPSPINPPSGCHFRTRCPYAIKECGEITPVLREIQPRHFAACIRVSPEEPDVRAVAAKPGNVYFPAGHSTRSDSDGLDPER